MYGKRNFLAWVEPHGETVVASFVSAAAAARTPAKRVCGSREEARQWIEGEAKAVGAPIEWVDPKAGVAGPTHRASKLT